MSRRSPARASARDPVPPPGPRAAHSDPARRRASQRGGREVKRLCAPRPPPPPHTHTPPPPQQGRRRRRSNAEREATTGLAARDEAATAEAGLAARGLPGICPWSGRGCRGSSPGGFFVARPPTPGWQRRTGAPMSLPKPRPAAARRLPRLRLRLRPPAPAPPPGSGPALRPRLLLRGTCGSPVHKVTKSGTQLSN